MAPATVILIRSRRVSSPNARRQSYCVGWSGAWRRDTQFFGTLKWLATMSSGWMKISCSCARCRAGELKPIIVMKMTNMVVMSRTKTSSLYHLSWRRMRNSSRFVGLCDVSARFLRPWCRMRMTFRLCIYTGVYIRCAFQCRAIPCVHCLSKCRRMLPCIC